MKKTIYVATALLFIAGSAAFAQTGNVGIGTSAPTVKLHVEGSEFLNAAITGGTTKNALDINVGQDGFSYGNRGENYGINMKTVSSADPGSIARFNFGDIQSTGMSGAGSRYLSFSVGKPLMELMYLTNVNAGRVGIGTITPAAKLHVAGNVAIVDGTQGAGKLLVSDASGIASWKSPAQTREVMALAPTDNQTVLAGVAPGSGTLLTNFSQSVNTIAGASFAGNIVNLPAGSYEITVSFEMSTATGTCPAAGFLINSYFIDFPVTGRIHANSPSVCGTNSVHSVQWTTTVITPAAGTAWGLTLGRGIGGNYAETVKLVNSSRIIVKKLL